MASKSAVYMDACCFIDMAKQAVGILESGRGNDVWHLRKLLEANGAGDVRVFTSVLSIAECVATDPGQTNIPDDTKQLFRRLLMSGRHVTLIQPTPFVGERARDLRWDHGILLRGADALHVASSLEVGCAEFLTTDGQISKSKMQAAISPLEALGLKVVRGSDTRALPGHYRQADMLQREGETNDATSQQNT